MPAAGSVPLESLIPRLPQSLRPVWPQALLLADPSQKTRRTRQFKGSRFALLMRAYCCRVTVSCAKFLDNFLPGCDPSPSDCANFYFCRDEEPLSTDEVITNIEIVRAPYVSEYYMTEPSQHISAKSSRVSLIRPKAP